jgi:hypothetical protein
MTGNGGYVQSGVFGVRKDTKKTGEEEKKIEGENGVIKEEEEKEENKEQN